MSEFITRVGGNEYQVIFKTNSNENYHAVEDFCVRCTPAVPAVPLDKLCEWLGKFANPCKIGIRCYYPDDNNEDCMPTVECWRYVLTKWMEEQEANDNR
jgi:hypothetical protein